MLNQANKNDNDVDDQQGMDNIFEKKDIGRPMGDFETVRKQYCEMLNKKELTNLNRKRWKLQDCLWRGNNHFFINVCVLINLNKV